MTRPRSAAALIGGCALILAVNAAILGGAAYNRRGDPQVVLALTEREMALPEFREEEGSATFLSFRFAGQAPFAVQRVAWRRQYELPPLDYPWLDDATLRSLGLRLDAETAHGRTAFVALEFDGEGWSRLMAAREEAVARPSQDADAKAVLELDRVMRSRLVPIDADRDEQALRLRQAGRPNTVVVAGVVDAVRTPSGPTGRAWRGRIFIAIPDVRVPVELRSALAPFLPKATPEERAARDRADRTPAWPAATPPRYRTVVAFGRRGEPWLVSVAPER